jgi:hypothetical protein
MLEKALEESAIPFFQVESNTINLWRNCQKFSFEQLLAATRAMHRRGREWETTTQTCVLCLTIFLSHPQKMARRKASIDPGTGHNVPSYHITWVAENGPPPKVSGGLEYSHRCHQKWCVAPAHGIWETNAVNRQRNGCAAGRSHFLLDNGPNDRHLIKICPHNPECLSGTFVQNMDHPAITKI